MAKGNSSLSEQDHHQVEEAAARLRAGDLVGLPTETVYGLAAPIGQPESLRRIFETKKRPFFDPLIVHVASIDQARSLVKSWPQTAEILARACWPGPLTMVLEKADLVDDLITAGLSTVGVRMPSHPLALALVEKIGPLAAPSANMFTKTSPTRAEHVRSEFPDLYVMDGGPCEVGLESTVLAIRREGERGIAHGSESPKSKESALADFPTTDLSVELSLLRPGHWSRESLTQVLVEAGIEARWIARQEGVIEAPGQVKQHYQPAKPLYWVERAKLGDRSPTLAELTEVLHSAGISASPEEMGLLHLGRDPRLAARELYSELRRLAEMDSVKVLVFVREEFHQGPDWQAILDRLDRASKRV